MTFIENARTFLYAKNTTVFALNLVALVGFFLNFLSQHMISYSLGKPGDSSKVK